MEGSTTYIRDTETNQDDYTMLTGWHSIIYGLLVEILENFYTAPDIGNFMTTVLVFGTFDIIHPGHRWFLSRARNLGDQLVAVVSRDNYVREWKGKPPVANQYSRIEALEESGLVDSAILSDPEIRTYGVVHAIRPEIICLGHDQEALKDDLEGWLLIHKQEFSPTVYVLPPWRRWQYKSSRRNRILRGIGKLGRSE